MNLLKKPIEPNSNWLTDMPRTRGMHPCGHCAMCLYVECSGVFADSANKHNYEIQYFINCATTWVLYILQCPCKKLYVGKTKCQLRIRIGEHLKSIKLKEETPVAQHFLQFHEGKSSDLRFNGFFVLNLSARRGDFDTVLLKKEKSWIFRLNTLQPNGLNNELSLKVFLEP